MSGPVSLLISKMEARHAAAAGAINIEGNFIRLGAEQPPRNKNFSAALIDGDHAAPKIFHLARGGNGGGGEERGAD